MSDLTMKRWFFLVNGTRRGECRAMTKYAAIKAGWELLRHTCFELECETKKPEPVVELADWFSEL